MLDNYKIELSEFELNYLYNLVKSTDSISNTDVERMFKEYLLKKLKI